MERASAVEKPGEFKPALVNGDAILFTEALIEAVIEGIRKNLKSLSDFIKDILKGNTVISAFTKAIAGNFLEKVKDPKNLKKKTLH